MSADMNNQMAQGRKGERLVVIDSPELPLHTRPPRIILLLAGTVLSGFAGVGGIFVGESLSRSVHGTRHLASLIGEPPLVAIPHIFTIAELHFIRRRRIRMASGAVAAVIVALFLFNELVMPLDVFGDHSRSRFRRHLVAQSRKRGSQNGSFR